MGECQDSPKQVDALINEYNLRLSILNKIRRQLGSLLRPLRDLDGERGVLNQPYEQLHGLLDAL
jgi:hypothetical protein